MARLTLDGAEYEFTPLSGGVLADGKAMAFAQFAALIRAGVLSPTSRKDERVVPKQTPLSDFLNGLGAQLLKAEDIRGIHFDDVGRHAETCAYRKCRECFIYDTPLDGKHNLEGPCCACTCDQMTQTEHARPVRRFRRRGA